MKHGLHFFHFFLPHGTPIYLAPLLVPIEVLSYLTRPFSLALRLFANMTAGHTLLKVFGGFVAGLGIIGMRERVELLGGTLEVESAPGTGTTIHLQLPSLLKRRRHAVNNVGLTLA